MGKNENKKVTVEIGDNGNDKIIVTDIETGKVKEIKAVLFTKEQSDKINEVVEKLYSTLEPPEPPKDRVFRETSLLETLTFGLYKTKEFYNGPK